MADDTPKEIRLVDDAPGRDGINLGHGHARAPEGKAHQAPPERRGHGHPLIEAHMTATATKPPAPPPPPTPGGEHIARPTSPSGGDSGREGS
jgi:hypothetical protein